MSTVLTVTLALLFVLITVLWLYMRRRPRLHHYLFAQGFLPNVALSKPDEVLSVLLSPTGQSVEGTSFLTKLWMKASEGLPDKQHLPAEGLTYEMAVLHSPRSAVYVVQLPSPLRPPEAYFAAITFDSVAFAAGSPPNVRYFTLERSFGGLHVIGESRIAANGELEHINHDEECSGTNKESFLNALREVVTDESAVGV